MATEWLTPNQLAAELQIEVKTLYQWKYRGIGPPVARIGRHLRYRRVDVDEWAQQRVTADEQQGY